MPVMFRWLIDSGFLAGKNPEGLDQAFGLILLLVFVLAVATAFRFFLVTTLGERISADLRNKVYGHLLLQRPAFFETLKVGEVLSRLTADTTLIQTLVGSSLSFALRNSLTTLGGLVMLVLTSPLLSTAVLVLVVVVMIPVVVLARRVRKLSRASQDKLADSSAIAQEVLNQITTVQAFNQEKTETHKFEVASEHTYNTARRRTVNRSALLFVAIGLAFAGLVVVLWMGAKAVALLGVLAPALFLGIEERGEDLADRALADVARDEHDAALAVVAFGPGVERGRRMEDVLHAVNDERARKIVA